MRTETRGWGWGRQESPASESGGHRPGEARRGKARVWGRAAGRRGRGAGGSGRERRRGRRGRGAARG
ncbi:PREDICTED: bromodomain and WD repeat-containing protein 3-like [Lipotes vexillifer]|uniref:Bromodomain and WD repeat-containing protein 3-like n=1 Tax=Lipotes vexillifer TaxID=118797 RepID=A0A340XA53_LIPVE|nr:PREDICTED: bromodomain and WD repeat-containing protein 3-like [Lipotes vexillifer]